MDSDRLMYGSIGAGVLVGLFLLTLLGWIGFYGWIAAGVAAGLAARGAARGLVAGLLAGILASVILIVFALFVPIAIVITLNSLIDSPFLTNDVFPFIYHVMGLPALTIIKHVAIDGIVIPALGGFVGGAILSNGYYVQEVAPKEEPVIPQEKGEQVS
ncbi:MAG: hypothetical protein M1476_06755 [Candidatus Thermoplasmatota archaeon]|nr:hypothetical protein [Candidatus Thermoplasmatota archaeon]